MARPYTLLWTYEEVLILNSLSKLDHSQYGTMNEKIIEVYLPAFAQPLPNYLPKRWLQKQG